MCVCLSLSCQNSNQKQSRKHELKGIVKENTLVRGTFSVHRFVCKDTPTASKDALPSFLPSSSSSSPPTAAKPTKRILLLASTHLPTKPNLLPKKNSSQKLLWQNSQRKNSNQPPRMNTSFCQKWNSSSSALQHLLFLQQLRLLCVFLFNNKSNRTRRKHKHPLRQNYWKGQQTKITTKRGGTASGALLTLKNSSPGIPGGGEFSRFLQISWLLPPGKETNRDFVPRMRG